MSYWLVTTDHLEDRILFRDMEDFIVGMNYVAVQAFKTEVIVLAFVLMSNHLHLVLLCAREDADAFMNGFKTAYSRYLWKKYGSREHLRRLKVDFREIEGDEALEWSIAYVQMNPVAANICVNPFDYPWGTGNCFFRPEMERNGTDVGTMIAAGGRSSSENTVLGVTVRERGRPVGSMSARERLSFLHSRAEVPGEWLLGEAGYVLPDSYVRKDIVESAYRTPRRMQYFLQNSSKAKQRIETGANMPAFRDQIILAAVPDLCQSLYRRRSVKELTEEQMVELLRQLRYRFSAGANQLARVTGLSYEVAAKYLDRI